MRLPKRIMPIVERLRAEAPAPGARRLYTINNLGPDYCPRFRNEEDKAGRCPMGLHPEARNETPYSAPEFMPPAGDVESLEHWRGIHFQTIQAFADWWDSLTLDKAEKAVEEIWKETK